MNRSIASRAMRAVVCLTVLSSLAGCLGTSFSAEPGRALTSKPCPPLYRYSESEMAQAGQEMDRLGADAQLWRMLDHYLYMRDACR